MSTIKNHKEGLYEFLQEPDREELRKILKSYDFENDNLDFKRDWVENSKLAKHILAFGNSGGGVIIFGISEGSDNTFKIDGLDKFKDHSDISVNNYLPEVAEEIYTIEEFDYEASEWDALEGEKFQVLFIEDTPQIVPLICAKDGKHVDEGNIYVRKNSRSKKAENHRDIERLINRRVESEPKTSQKNIGHHLSQLRQIKLRQSESISSVIGSFGTISPIERGREEAYQKYLSRLEKQKKEVIEREPDIK